VPGPARTTMPHVFVSYSHDDLNFACRLEQALKDARVPVWRDLEGIRPGMPFRPVIDQGLAQARVVLVLVSRVSVHSDWVTWETERALARKIPIVPVLVDGTKPVGKLGGLAGINLYNWRVGHPHEELDRLIVTLRGGAGGRRWHVTPLGPGRLEIVLDHQQHILEFQRGQLFVNGRSTGSARPVVTNEREFVFQLQDGAQFYPADLFVQLTMFRGDPKRMRLTVGGRTLYES
jgi:hypothetical protein